MKSRIPIAQPELGAEELQNLTEAFKSGWVSSKGPFIEKFEQGFSRYIGTKYGVSTSNGTTALHLALVALGIGKGDKVLVPSLTFVAVANAVSYTGATPVFVDADPEYWCMDPSKIEAEIDEKTKAIIPVHLYGHPCEMEKIKSVADSHKLIIIEDCAEAHGAEYKGKKVGSFGCISCFSFYGNKIITTGEGGICLTDNEEIASKMRILRDHGMNPDKKYWHDIIGFNYRMTNLQAAIGVAQLSKIEFLINRKREIAAMYAKLLRDLPSITPAPEMPWAKSVYWLYSILVEKKARNRIIDYLDKEGIETRPFFYPIPMLPPYRSSSARTAVAEELSNSGLNLPSGFKLTNSQIEKIIDSLAQCLHCI
jgi:perosamine synthetase